MHIFENNKGVIINKGSVVLQFNDRAELRKYTGGPGQIKPEHGYPTNMMSFAAVREQGTGSQTSKNTAILLLDRISIEVKNPSYREFGRYLWGSIWKRQRYIS